MRRHITLHIELIHNDEMETYSDVDLEDAVHRGISRGIITNPINVSVTNVEELKDYTRENIESVKKYLV